MTLIGYIPRRFCEKCEQYGFLERVCVNCAGIGEVEDIDGESRTLFDAIMFASNYSGCILCDRWFHPRHTMPLCENCRRELKSKRG